MVRVQQGDITEKNDQHKQLSHSPIIPVDALHARGGSCDSGDRMHEHWHQLHNGRGEVSNNQRHARQAVLLSYVCEHVPCAVWPWLILLDRNVTVLAQITCLNNETHSVFFFFFHCGCSRERQMVKLISNKPNDEQYSQNYYRERPDE